jgi:hypothetical protein
VVNLWVHKVLVVDVIYLLGLHDFVFVEEFECDVFAGLLVLSNLNFAEATCMKKEVPLPSTRPIS